MTLAETTNPTLTQTLLYLDGVSVSFDGYKALRSLSLVLQPGEMRAIIGPNGAGKTTMMDVITGKTRPDEGEAMFDGRHDLTKLDEAEIATLGIGRKFQKPTVFENHTVEDNLLLATKAPRSVRATLFGHEDPKTRQTIDAILATTRLADHRARIAGSLSHGQKQWLEIGMLLAQDPKLLLVDEPVAGMTDSNGGDRRSLTRNRARSFGSRGRARHAFRARARGQGHVPARGLGAGGRHARSGERRPACRRSLSGALNAQRRSHRPLLRRGPGASLGVAQGRGRTNLMRARTQRRRQVVASARHRRPARRRFRLDPVERQRGERAAWPPAGKARFRLCAPGARDFSAAVGPREPDDRIRGAAARSAHHRRRDFQPVSCPQRHARTPGRRFVRRSATAAGDRPRAGDASKAPHSR